MDNQEKIIYLTSQERNDIVKLLDAYKGMVDKRIETLPNKHKPFQIKILAQCIQCSKDVKLIIDELKNR